MKKSNVKATTTSKISKEKFQEAVKRAEKKEAEKAEKEAAAAEIKAAPVKKIQFDFTGLLENLAPKKTGRTISTRIKTKLDPSLDNIPFMLSLVNAGTPEKEIDQIFIERYTKNGVVDAKFIAKRTAIYKLRAQQVLDGTLILKK